MGSPLPVRGITGHLVWGTDGAAWACFEVDPFAYPHRSTRDARDTHARTVAALLGLPTHSLVLSVAAHVSQDELERRIRGSSETGQPSGWAAVARRTALRLSADPVVERLWFLAVHLPEPGGTRGLVDRLRAAAAEVSTGLGSPPPSPGGRRVAAAMAASRSLADQLGQHLQLRPLKSAEVRWLFERAVLRGLTEPPLARDGSRDRVSVVRLDRDAVYFEGGRRNDPNRPAHWRYLTVEHPDYGTGHQAFSCLAELPASWSFPYGSGEWLWHLDDQLPFPVDWALRIEKVDNQAARRRALRAKRNLVGQLTEPGGDPAGPATTLTSSMDMVDEQRARLESNPALPAFRATTIVAVAHRDLAEVEHRTGILEAAFRAAEFNFYRPTGAQLACFTAMLPGAASPPVVREYAQDLLPDGLASAMPFAGTGVGDPGGMLLGHSLDTQYRVPVFLDPAYGPRDLNRSGSLAAIGELGSGKSFLAKTLAYNTVAMGGQVVVVDRTDACEYGQLAAVLPGQTQIVEISAGAKVGLDPFQVFDTDELRLRYGVGFITLLTATPPGSAAAAHCYRAAQETLESAAETGTRPRLRDLVTHLGDGPGVEVAEKLAALAGISYGRLVFDDPGPAVDLSGDYVCFHIPGLRLPRTGTARDDQLPEELLSQAILYLVAAFSRRVLFRSRDRFAALLLDEAHALTSSAQGHRLVMDLIRDGRKHYSAVWAFSQLPTDLTGHTDNPSEDVDALLGYRMVFRQPHQSAPGALRFLGSDGRDDNLATVTSLGTGECLMRDPDGRLGLVRIAVPDDPTVADAFSTTPGTAGRVMVGPWPSLTSPGDAPATAEGVAK